MKSLANLIAAAVFVASPAIAAQDSAQFCDVMVAFMKVCLAAKAEGKTEGQAAAMLRSAAGNSNLTPEQTQSLRTMVHDIYQMNRVPSAEALDGARAKCIATDSAFMQERSRTNAQSTANRKAASTQRTTAAKREVSETPIFVCTDAQGYKELSETEKPGKACRKLDVPKPQ